MPPWTLLPARYLDFGRGGFLGQDSPLAVSTRVLLHSWCRHERLDHLEFYHAAALLCGVLLQRWFGDPARTGPMPLRISLPSVFSWHDKGLPAWDVLPISRKRRAAALQAWILLGELRAERVQRVPHRAHVSHLWPANTPHLPGWVRVR